MPAHDPLYHRLFSQPFMVAELLRGFVTEPWIANLDLDNLDRMNAKSFPDGAHRRDGDMIWKIPLRSGGDAYLLLLLEFQSRPDPWMALRMLVYAGALWQQLVAENSLLAGGKLPPIFPLVLYNGRRR